MAAARKYLTAPRGSLRNPFTSTLLLLFLFHLLPQCSAHTDNLNEISNIRCTGMYAQSSIPGARANGSISVSLDKIDLPVNITFLIFNYQDDRLLHTIPNDPVNYAVCDDYRIQDQLCPPENWGKFVVKEKDDKGPAVGPILNEVQFVNTTEELQKLRTKYIIAETAYYCVIVLPIVPVVGGVRAPEIPFTATVTYENPYGLLPAVEYPKLPLYGFLSITYLVLGLAWMWKAFTYWRDLLPIQSYISGVICFLVVEQAFNYGYYEDYNRKGQSSTPLLVIVAILNAGRNSVSFFILLIVSLGYGVVKPTLGNTMKKCLYLTYTHFVFGVLYAAGSMVVTELNGIVVLMFVFPLSATLNFLYLIIFTGILILWRPTENNQRYGLDELAQDDFDDDDVTVTAGQQGGQQIKLRTV
ncbi:hypothetical protein HK102_002912, partial [Quaeritorhiza haematococci]